VSDSGAPPEPHARMTELDRALERDPDCIAARFERASLLRERGSYDAAKRDYLELLRRAPTHFGALNDFGTMLLATGFREAARTVFSAAVEHHPDNPKGHVNLGNLLHSAGEHASARMHFEAALRIDPDHVHAHRGIGNLLADIGDEAGARRHRDKGFANHFLTTMPYRGDRDGASALLLVSAQGGNIPTSSILDERTFRTTVLVAEYFDRNLPLPAHDLVFNGIGDADLCREGLEAACAIVARTTRPVINPPAAVLATGRVANAARLRGMPDVVVPRMAALPRHLLAGPQGGAAVAAHEFAFPLLLRAPGFHTGRHFMRVEGENELAAAATALPGDTLWVIEELDARDRGGTFRKYRVMTIENRPYPLHLAISRDWKVHYYTADMAESAAHREHDAAFLADMTGTVGPRGMAALARISATLALDYGGIDFAVDRDGKILFFEANATMVVYPPTDEPKWAYRRAAVERVLAAVRAMLVKRAGRITDGSNCPASSRR
jgi:hypothetical protein